MRENLIEEEIKSLSPTSGKRKTRSASQYGTYSKKRFIKDPLKEQEFTTVTNSTPFIVPKMTFVKEIKLQP